MHYNDAWNAHDVETIVSFHAPDMVFENHTAGDRVEGDAVGPAHCRDLRAQPRPSVHGTPALCPRRPRRQRVDGDRDESHRPAHRVGRDRRLPVRERPDPAQGRLLVLAQPALSRRLGRVPRPRVHEAAGVPSEIELELRAAFELVGSPHLADGVVVTPAVRVDAAYLDAAGPQLRIVANYAVGTDNVDLEAARARGVVVSNTPGVLTNATAEHTIGLMLALLRRIGEGDRSLRRRDRWEWGPDFMVGEGLEGKEVLVVGPGRIGRRVAELAEAHGARVSFAGRGDDLATHSRAPDVVSLHCPLTRDPSPRRADALASMKPTAVLVNTARGQVVDEPRSWRRSAPARSRAPRSTSSSTSPRSARSCSRWRTSSSLRTSRARRDARHAMGMLCVALCARCCSRANALERGVASRDAALRLASMTGRLERVLVRPPLAEDVEQLARVRLARGARSRCRGRRARALPRLLEAAGAEVVVSQHDPGNPDAIYVYDPVLVGAQGAVLLRPARKGAAASRRASRRALDGRGRSRRG